jgi:aldehyde:ferredoxin oxidoreductase
VVKVIGGYMGKMLFVDLSRREIKTEALDEKFCRDFIGGYGIGARILYSRQRAGVDPLGPENMLGFITGPLTGVPGTFGTRYVVVSKSPLTGVWGDANSGGDFGPFLKFAGYDAVFFTGASDTPVYLLIKDGKAELRDAFSLWGKHTGETEALLKSELGEDTRISSIGPGGEKLSLISSIIHSNRAAARSGLGAVMGSKKLKAVAVKGNKKVPIGDVERYAEVRKDYASKLKGNPFVNVFRKFGTSVLNVQNVQSGNAPCKNWSGVGVRDFPNAAALSHEKIAAKRDRKFACWRCPVACGALMKAGTEYDYIAGVSRPEYETWSSFGPLCLNDNLESIIKVNDICNQYGLDTISAGTTIAFAIDCYENGLITKEDTDGIEMTWGNHRAIVAMTEKLAKREGFGAVLADGVKVAAEKIGKSAGKYAYHIYGQELPMHDPSFGPSFGCSYQTAPTPGRHTQAGLCLPEEGAIQQGLVLPPEALEKYTYTGKGEIEAKLRGIGDLGQAAGMCLLGGNMFLPYGNVQDFLRVVTGWNLTDEELATTAQRIATIRKSFSFREGLRPNDCKVRGHAIGDPPDTEGPLANITVDVDTLSGEYYRAVGWDPVTGKPTKEKLLELGLDDVAADLWP